MPPLQKGDKVTIRRRMRANGTPAVRGGRTTEQIGVVVQVTPFLVVVDLGRYRECFRPEEVRRR